MSGAAAGSPGAAATSAVTPLDPALAAMVAVRPSQRQLAWQAMEFTAFVHFGMNTMTDREWGAGHEDPALFDPEDVDTDQWMAAVASAGMTGVILTAKHHDGFCLWPSAVTRHSVAASPWRGGHGDLVGEVADAARRHGLRFGVYLSPWDRTEASYGSGRAYDDFYVAQLTELLTGYGDVFSVWFDGANGEGPNGRRQVYDWDRYYAVIRELQPGAVINVCGPDVRWCGNEAGHTRADEWSVVPRALQDAERIAERSQQVDDGTFTTLVRSDEEDLGSRAALAGHEDDLVWYPAEVNTSIRPGWFHHPAEDDAVRSVDELFAIHRSAVGGNAGFLLNVPPTRAGRIAEPDVAVLAELGERIADQRRRVVEADVEPSSGVVRTGGDGWPRPDIGSPAGPALDLANGTGRWEPEPGDASPHLTLRLAEPTVVEAVVIKEEIAVGQRIERAVVTAALRGALVLRAEFGAVGYQRIVPLAPELVDTVTIEIRLSRAVPVIAGVAVVRAAVTPGG
ncbi:alpha-L-fucosidase [Curtobacterium sp. MCBD17_040]|uniref:alpha-L-fucosidase n=1 Tax=Curtobacterium sp. MCBD17_040 TaxID=2175674 RepID=UPI0021ABC0B8|nr:alpha-L-fucosidase [Curtobacterium sp. MCBD17_040]WIB62968.1 alpha-L-fucosidase [Curtobacterium sp. MCBD17_040]